MRCIEATSRQSVRSPCNANPSIRFRPLSLLPSNSRPSHLGDPLHPVHTEYQPDTHPRHENMFATNLMYGISPATSAKILIHWNGWSTLDRCIGSGPCWRCCYQQMEMEKDTSIATAVAVGRLQALVRKSKWNWNWNWNCPWKSKTHLEAQSCIESFSLGIKGAPSHRFAGPGSEGPCSLCPLPPYPLRYLYKCKCQCKTQTQRGKKSKT